MQWPSWNKLAVITISFLVCAIEVRAAAPTISNLSIPSGAVGAAVTITGTNFGTTQGSSTVKFNGTTAAATWVSSTSIQATVPVGATTGNVVVTVSNKASNGVSFTVVPAPSISTLSIPSGAVGAAVTITGTNFGASQGTTGAVKFNGTTATVTSWSATSIAVTVPVGATSGNVVVNASGVASIGVSFTVVPAPSISTLSIPSGPVGAAVTITGTNLATPGTVTFNGTTASVTSWSATSIGVTVPSGATSGNVVVNASGVASNPVNFTVAPSISTLSIPSGAVGAAVTITGTSFGASQGTGTVKFNGTTASVTSWSATSIAVTVPSGATTGNVVVNASGVASIGVSFTVVPPPSITSLSPTSGAAGSPITITGTNFGSPQGNGTVAFNGTAATATTWSATSIVAPIPVGATTGNVVVTASGVISNGMSLTVIPTAAISTVSPNSGAAGAAVTIAGTNFGATQGTSTVTFSGIAATATSWSATSITVHVPPGAITGNVVVTVAGGNSNGVNFNVLSGPSIASLSPSAGASGTSVTISGANFGLTQGTGGSVAFSGTTATISSWGSASIVALVPAGATTGNVVVYSAGIASNGVNFAVNSTGTLSGLITKAVDGTPIVGATIKALQGGATIGTASSTANGSYSISSLPTGTYDVQFSAATFGASVSTGVSITSGGTISLNASLSAPGSIIGQVTSYGTTTGISGASIAVYLGAEPIGTSTTDANGNYTVSGMGPGTYRIEASAAGYLTQDQTGLTVSGGNSTTENLSLSAASSGTISYSYDELGRLVTAIAPSGSGAGYAFDPVGNLLSIGLSTAGQVSILSFVPTGGPVGSTVMITGTGFSSSASQNGVSFGGANATPTSATVNQIAVVVPSGSVTGPITLTTPGGTATSNANFTISTGNGQPTITSFNPTIGTIGSTLTITGSNFDSAVINNRLTLNRSYEAISAATGTTLTAAVPARTSSGRFSVITANGSAQSSQDFFIPFGSHVASDVGYTGRTSIGGSQTISLNTASKIGLLVFDGVAGQAVSAQLSGSTFATCTLSLYSPNGTQVSFSYCSSSYGLFDGVTLPATGTYTFGLDPSGGTGSLNVSLLNATSVTKTITPGGPPVTITTTTAGQDARLTFNSPIGQRFSILTNNVTNPYVPVYLIRPGGTPQSYGTVGVASGNLSSFIDVQTSTGTGYVLLLSHSGTYVGSETVQVYIVPADVSAATTIGGTPVSISTPIPGQNASVTFSGTTGQKVSVSVSNGSYGNCVSTWKNPDGSTLVSGNCGSFDPQTLPQTGTYTIFLDPQGAYTGGLTLQVSDASDVTATATPGGAAVTVTTTVVGQDARVNFSATSGQRVSAYVYNVTNPGLSVNLVPPVGTTQSWGFLGSYYGSSTRLIDAQTLTATGTYAVWLQHQGGFVGSETVQVYNVPADASYTTTVGGAPVSVSTTAPGQNASVTFSGTTGQKISISMWNLNLGNCNLALKNPDGSTLTNGSCSGGYVDTQTLVQMGTYTIFLDPQGNATGGLTLQVNNDSDVTATATPGGSAVTVTTTAPGQDARVTFSATAGQRISFFVSNVTNPYIFVSLIFPSGSSQSEGTLGSSVGVTSRFVDSQILSAAGTYTVLLAHGSTSAGSETVQVYSVPSDASGTTTIGGSAVPITTTVPGQNGGVTFSGTTGQSVTVSLSSGTFTSCNLTLKNPDGSNLSTGSCSGSGGGVGPVTLGQTGTFTIFIDPQGTVTGSTNVLVH